MSDHLLLGIDMGTSSSKGVLVRTDGTIVATRTVPRPRSMQMPRTGWAEVDAEGVWWSDVVRLSRELLADARGQRVAGVCVSGVGPCLVLCDDQNRPTRPAILYGIDMRATAEIDDLTRRLGAGAIEARAGNALSSQATGPKALWVRRHEPDIWARSTRWYNSSSFIVARLTGEYVLDHHTASQCDPCYDLAAREWYAPWAAEVMDALPLPRLAWPGEVVGTVTSAAAALTGLPVGTPVCAGTVDAWAEAFSAGVRRPGDVMLMYGSTMFVVKMVDELTRRPPLWATAGVDPGSYTVAAGMATSGSLLRWICDLVGEVPLTTLAAEAARVPPGSDGLLVLPYFAGERSPIFDPRARGLVAGLTLRHTRGHLFRAAYEGVAYGIRQILELLDADALPVQRIVAVGGGVQGNLWPQIVSDVTGHPQWVPAETIGASYGGALLAAIGVGLVPPDTDWTRQHHLVQPDERLGALYQELYAGFSELYPATRPVIHRLASLQEAADPSPQPPG